MTIDENIKVMQAYRDGEKIEMRVKKLLSGWTYTHNPAFNFDDFEYRIAPKKPREFWLCPESWNYGRLGIYPVEQLADASNPINGQIHVREVID